jgi:hypothetical protein
MTHEESNFSHIRRGNFTVYAVTVVPQECRIPVVSGEVETVYAVHTDSRSTLAPASGSSTKARVP